MNTEALQIARTAVQLYAETHPRPGSVTQAQAAVMLNVSRATICRMVGAGVFKLNRLGQIPIDQVDAALLAA